MLVTGGPPVGEGYACPGASAPDMPPAFSLSCDTRSHRPASVFLLDNRMMLGVRAYDQCGPLRTPSPGRISKLSRRGRGPAGRMPIHCKVSSKAQAPSGELSGTK